MARACVRTNTLAYNTLTHASHARLSTVAAGRGVCGGRNCPTDSVALRLCPPLLGRLRRSALTTLSGLGVARCWLLPPRLVTGYVLHVQHETRGLDPHHHRAHRRRLVWTQLCYYDRHSKYDQQWCTVQTILTLTLFNKLPDINLLSN